MKTNQVKQFGRLRTFRMRVLNDNYTIAPINNWDRTVCASDIKKFLECEALYLQWKEGDATGEQSITEQVGDIVHEETAKPEGQRINDLASRITTVTDKVERERVVAEVKKLIEVSTAAQKADSKGAKVSKKEETLVYFDDYTQTWWYAKLDSTDLKSNDRGAYLNVIDQKAGRYRSAMQLTSVFFQAYVAKMSKAFGHEGPIRYAVRYLRDRFGNILNTPELDPEAYRATLDGAPLDLTRTEFELLHFLLRSPGRAFSRSYLLDAVWGEHYIAGDRSVDNAILRLRRKLGPLGEAIETVWGVGYRLLSPDEVKGAADAGAS